MNSAIYRGWVRHKRFATEATGQVAHEFRYASTMPYLYLDELEQLTALHPRFSTTRPDALWYRRHDFGGDRSVDLASSIRDEVAAAGFDRPSGRIAMLAHVRTWGFLFNPLATFYVFDEHGVLAHVVLEVRSTPWLERHRYVLDAAASAHRFAKELHVSPFLTMDHEYVCTVPAPGEHLSLHLGNRRGDERIFDASLSMQRVAITKASLAKLIWRRPLATYGVTFGIYREALRLWRKRAPFITHPNKLRAQEK